jgi:purine-binding chemotaxis protein CheW
MSDKWLILRIDKQEYAMQVDVIVEVLRMVAIRPLPDAQPWMAGIMNMRGSGVPVMDLRIRLGMRPKEYGVDMVIIAFQVGGRAMGLIVDQAVEFLTFPPQAIRQSDAVGRGGLLNGMVQAGERLILVLEPQRLITEDKQLAAPVPGV